MTHDTLTKIFTGKRLTRIVNRTAQNPLPFNALLVYSCLVLRATHGKGASNHQLRMATGLHESTAIPAALQRLARCGLVVKKGKYWLALEPVGETTAWFKNRKDSRDQAWHRRFSYWWMGLRSKNSPLTTKQNAVYFKLVDVCSSARWRTQKGVQRLLGLDRKTVRSALAKLRTHGLVKDGLSPIEPTDAHLDWFRGKPKKRAFRLSAHFDFSKSGIDGQTASALLESFVPALIDAGYSERQITAFFLLCLERANHSFSVFFTFLTGFKKVFERVEKDHLANRATGKYGKAANSLGLLKQEAMAQISKLRKRMKK
jgi:hypothetical protein